MRLRTSIALAISLIVGLGAVTAGVMSYQRSKRALLAGLDSELFAVARLTPELLPADYHDGITGPDSVPEAEYRQIAGHLDELCQELELEYIWSLMVIDDELVFTSFGSTNSDLTPNDYPDFLKAYGESGNYGIAIRTMEVQFQQIESEWGHTRVVLIPSRDSHDRPFVFGAAMRMTEVEALTGRVFRNVLVAATGVMLIAILVSALLGDFLARPLAELTRTAEGIAAGDLSRRPHARGIAEIESLARSVDVMRQSIQSSMAELQQSEAKHRAMIANISDVIAISDRAGVNTYKSPNIERLFGWKPEEVVGQPTVQNVHPEDREAAMASLMAVFGSSEPLSGECRYLCADGTYRWIEFTAVDMLEDPQIRGLLINYHDIEARRLAKSERDTLETQLRQSQKMEAVGLLAGGVAHDFNNLLQVILGYSDIAASQAEPGTAIHTSLGEVLKAGNRAATLVSQLLAFGRRQVLEMTPLDLNEVVSDVMKMIRRVIGEHVALEFIPGRNPWAVKADRGQIEQILVNLCVNARDAMPDGGSITIRTGNITLSEEFCRANGWARPGDHVLTSVTDTGCGMTEEILANAFEPFFTTKEVGSGTGLGLSTVFGLVEQHEGLLHAESEPGVGTTIAFYLPSTSAGPQGAEELDEAAPRGGTETILIAEDDDAVRRLSVSVLEQAGYTVLTARNGKEALTTFGESSDRIDLVVLDVMMPELGGRAVYERVKGSHPDMPTLFCSGYSMDAIHTDFVLDEGLTLLSKPASPVELLHAVRTALDGPASPSG